MPISPFLLVFWTEEARYSVVPRKSLADESLQLNRDADLVNSITKVNWKKVPYDAEVVDCGKRISKLTVNAFKMLISS